MRVLGSVFYVGVLFFALLIGTVFGVVRRSPLTSTIFGDLLHGITPKQAFKNKNSVTLLLLGCDEERFDGDARLNGSRVAKKYTRADMILVAKLDFDKKVVTGLSIPRDTEVALPGFDRGRKHKINAFHSIAKPSEADHIQELAVERLLPGVDIDKVVVLNYEAFQQLVDAVGGVQINVPKQMDYDDNAGDLHIHFKPGPQHLNGYQAMGYVRFRHDSESDFGRQQRQKDFLLAFKKAAVSNLFRLPEIVEMGKSSMNGALDDHEIAGLVNFAKSIQPTQIRMGMLPVREVSGTTMLKPEKRKIPAALAEFNLLSDQARKGRDN